MALAAMGLSRHESLTLATHYADAAHQAQANERDEVEAA